MTDGQILLIAVGALTLYECARWVPVRAWVFQAAGSGRWSGSRPWEILRARGGGIALLFPLPPVEAHLVAASWPCVPYESGLCLWHDESGVAQIIPWEEVKVRSSGSVLLVSAAEKHHTRCVHATSATDWVKTIRNWRTMGPAERQKDFAQRAARMLDESALTKAAAEFQKQTRWLRYTGGVIFWWTFLALPFAYWRFGDAVVTYATAGVLWSLMVMQFILLLLQIRRQPVLRGDAFTHLMSALIFPPSAMRAADWVCASLGPETHPLAAHHVWSREGVFESVAEETWRKARWPLGNFTPLPSEGPDVVALKKFFHKHQVSMEKLEPVPVRQDDCTDYCPRCLNQYRAPATTCPDCGGMKLLPLPEAIPALVAE